MAKFNTTGVLPAKGQGFIKSSDVSDGVTHEGGAGFSRNGKSELFLLAVSNFYGEGSFYESAENRDDRFISLARSIAVGDPEWFGRFVAWLRGDGNIRSAALVAALEGADALRLAEVPGGRKLVSSVLTRGDEPGEALAYWISVHGRKIPQPIKRGIADAATKVYSEYSLGKYDAKGRGFRFGDVIELVHPTPKGKVQSNLFKYALDRRRDSKVDVPENLTMLKNRAKLLAMPASEIREIADRDVELLQVLLQEAGLTWEALSGIISGGMDAKAWESVIPSMGYMALLRNLRNFEQAGVSSSVLDAVGAKLEDENEVAKSKQLPMRFLSAYNATQHSLQFGKSLERALNHSLKNVPVLKGKTLILVDRSGSMFWSQSQKSDLTFADSAAIFGTALALRAENATLVEYGSWSSEIKLPKGASVLKSLEKFNDMGGTNTVGAIKHHFNGHDRVVLVTDEQYSSWRSYSSTPSDAVPSNVPLYTWNLAGYKYGQSKASRNRYTFGGLTDSSFRLIDLVERGLDSSYPF